MADETVVPFDDNATKRYRRKGSLLNEVQLKSRRTMYCESYQTYQFRTLRGSNTLTGIFIRESRMRENLTYGLTRGQGKQSLRATAPLSYSTVSRDTVTVSLKQR